ncbi:hypothetical protein ACIBPB_30305 [Micromonospora sp. NPDC049836]|uniref:hypothetical protein n=1 Tax=Micromonospora sp. NPDC049836 TaxID=3364274 RepID=UPI003791E5F5
MRLSRMIMALTVGVAVAAVPTAAGAAQPQPAPSASTPQPPYVPQTAQLTVDPTSIRLGETVTLRGRGFGPGETVRITVAIRALPQAAPARLSDGTSVDLTTVSYAQAPQPAPRDFTVVADGAGNFTVDYRPTRVGVHTFTATGQTTGRTDDAVLTVRPPRVGPPPHGGGHLPVTGSSLSTPMKVGGGLAGAGAVLVLLSLAWRRRDRFGLGSR